MNMRMRQVRIASTTRRPLVAVAIGSTSEVELAMLDGIRAGAGAWDLVVLTGGYETPLRRLAETGELVGTIGDFVSDAWVEELRSHDIRVVQLAHGSMLRKSPNIGVDFEKLGVDAVESLARGGVKSIGFVGMSGQHASGMMEKAARAQAGVRNIRFATTSGATLPLLRTWLSEFSPPFGILAASDRLARLVIAAAESLSWKVPGDLAVIGVGNQRMESVFAGLPISSFELPSRAIGRAAANAMDALIRNPEQARRRGRVHHKFSARLIERESSLNLTQGLGRALAFVDTHFAGAIQVDDLARIAGMSRRALELAIRRDCGVSPAALVAGVRRREAERLLLSEDISVQQVGANCGYPEPERFSAAFRRWTGFSPREFRQRPRS